MYFVTIINAILKIWWDHFPFHNNTLYMSNLRVMPIILKSFKTVNSFIFIRGSIYHTVVNWPTFHVSRRSNYNVNPTWSWYVDCFQVFKSQICFTVV